MLFICTLALIPSRFLPLKVITLLTALSSVNLGLVSFKFTLVSSLAHAFSLSVLLFVNSIFSDIFTLPSDIPSEMIKSVAFML